MDAAGRCEIEAACIRLSVAFAVNVDRRHYETVASLFAPDAIYRPARGEFIGPDGVLDYLRSRPTSRRSRHVLANHLIDIVSPGQARGSCVFTYFVNDDGDPERPAPLHLAAVGDYDDRFVLTDRGWKFAERLCTIVFDAQVGSAGK